MTFQQLFGFQGTVPSAAEAHEIMDDESYMVSMRAGGPDFGYYEMEATNPNNWLRQSDHNYPALGVEETVFVNYEANGTTFINAGPDSIYVPGFSDHDAVLIHLYSQGGTPYNKLTVTRLVVNGEPVDGFTPLVVEIGVKYDDLFLIEGFSRTGSNLDSYEIEIGMKFESVFGSRSGGDDLRIDVIGVKMSEAVIDPAELSYDVLTSMSDVGAVLIPSIDDDGELEQLQLSWKGSANTYYVLETSTDLVEWTTVLNNYFVPEPDVEVFDYVDVDIGVPNKYYRLKQAVVAD